jgi:nitrite reductase (NO-forming)
MGPQANQISELPWDRRPVTSRDLVISIGILVLSFIGGAVLLGFSIQGLSGTAVVEGTGPESVSAAEQAMTAESIGLGRTIFETQCTACHSIGAGNRVGPDLQGVTERRDRAWLASWIAEPDKMLAKGDPIATQLFGDFNQVPMPNLQLSNSDVENVIAFLGNPGSSESGAATMPTHEEPVTGANIVHHPADIPQPVGDREPRTVHVDLQAEEVVGQLAEGATYSYFTFNGSVPGPMLRVRVGDTVELRLSNADENQFPHSIDLHAVNGPGGGHLYTETNPGEENLFTFKALAPGLYVYHCATPSVPHHITNGMYGLILVEPEGGLPAVDHEYYVMQGEIYTGQVFGSTGELTFSLDKMLRETPEYYVFNGAANALTLEGNVLKAKVGETVRIFFGVGGPNKTSSFHVIGEIFDRAYNFASLTSPPLTNVQTVTVPPGGAWMVEFEVNVPGTYILVDHALSRLERGLVGYLVVEGEEQPEIYHQGAALEESS